MKENILGPKKFYKLTPGVNVIKHSSSLQKMRPNKLECLYLAITFQSSLTLLETPGAYPRRKHLKGLPIGFALALPSNSKTRLEGVSRGKPSSYWASSSVMKEKSFITLTPGPNVIKLFRSVIYEYS